MRLQSWACDGRPRSRGGAQARSSLLWGPCRRFPMTPAPPHGARTALPVPSSGWIKMIQGWSAATPAPPEQSVAQTTATSFFTDRHPRSPFISQSWVATGSLRYSALGAGGVLCVGAGAQGGAGAWPAFPVRDDVMSNADAEVGKLRPLWMGPCPVAAVVGPNTYRLTCRRVLSAVVTSQPPDGPRQEPSPCVVAEPFLGGRMEPEDPGRVPHEVSGACRGESPPQPSRGRRYGSPLMPAGLPSAFRVLRLRSCQSGRFSVHGR